jgi:hypothetical protein
MMTLSHSSIFDVVLQSHLLLYWYMSGVSNVVLLEEIIDAPSWVLFSSIDN